MNRYIVLSLTLILVCLTACGGSNGKPAGQVKDVITYSAMGSVTLPVGFPLATSDVQVHGIMGVSTVNADGSFTVLQPSEGPALVTLNDAHGNIMLLGYVDSTDTQMGRLSALSTAATLMFFDVGGFTLPAGNWKEMLALIEAEQTVKDLANVIGQRLTADRAALQNGEQEIKDAVRAAHAALNDSSGFKTAAKAVPSKSVSGDSGGEYSVVFAKSGPSKGEPTVPMQITVTSQNPASGIQVSGDLKSDGLIITNNYRRHCYYWVYYTGYQDEAGTDHMLSSALWELKESDYLKSTGALSGVIGTSIDFAWGKIPYIPVNKGPMTLGMPDGAQKAYYKVVVVGGTTLLGYLPPDWVNENVNRISYIEAQNLMGSITVVKDYFLPTFFALAPVSKVQTFSGKELGDFCAGIVGLVAKTGATVSQDIASHNYDGAYWSIWKAVMTDGTLRKTVCKYIATRMLDAVLTDEAIEKMGTTAKGLNDLLKKVDITMMVWDIGGVTKDLAMSNGYECFDVIAVKPNVHIEPSSRNLMAGDEQIFNVIKGTVTGDTFEYRWAVAGSATGKLHREGETTLANEITTSTPTIVYKASAGAAKESQDTITVEVYRKQITDSGVIIQLIGTDQAVVTISDIVSIQSIKRFYHSDNGEINILHMAYFILKKRSGNQGSHLYPKYCIQLEDNGYFYSDMDGGGLWGEGQMGTFEFCLGMGGVDQYNSSAYGLPVTLSDHTYNAGHPPDVWKLVSIAEDEMLFIVGCYNLNINASRTDAEAVLWGWYNDWGIESRWNDFMSKAEYWTVTNIFTY